MSKSKYNLGDFIETVPSCLQTATLAMAWETFSQEQSDRLIVLDRQRFPLGVLHLRQFFPHWLAATNNSKNVKQSLSKATARILEPIEKLPNEFSLEQFQSYIDSRPELSDIKQTFAIVDAEGKFLGLLEQTKLWKVLAAAARTEKRDRLAKTTLLKATIERGIEPEQLDPIVQLLERLPLPLMLQTSLGEAIAQNPAWNRQFGNMGNPEAIRQEVEAILNVAGTQQSVIDLESATAAEVTEASREVDRAKLSDWQATTHHFSLTALQEQVSLLSTPDAAEPNIIRYCQQGEQEGTCICVCPGQQGQDRVWQFLKIPLQMSVVSRQQQSERIWLLMATDVTEQRQMASELAAKNADLIQLNRLKDEFLACISHELRTPLTAMLGLSTLLKDQALGQLNERQARYARLIHENGRHLMSVVNDILDLTRMETGQLELTLEPVHIRKVCERAVEQARLAFSPKNNKTAVVEAGTDSHLEHRFTLAIEPELDIIVADELRLRQMLVHLLANAFKFTASGGEIGLRVSYWAGWIAFTVWDTGIGIPEHQQHLIFQKFQQLETPLTRQFEGTGLGLVLTRALARLHGGDVSFLSQEGKGSQFTLLLAPTPPKKRAGGAGGAGEAGEAGEQVGRTSANLQRQSLAHIPTGNNALAAQSRTPGRGESNFSLGSLVSPAPDRHLVLVVEAAPRFIEDLAEQLTSLGYWVAIARSGTEALEKARRLQPGIIFINPLLPLLSGWDVLTLLKSDPATSQIPIVVTTTRAEKNQALSHRADEFISLPVQQQVLQQVMTRLCGAPVTHSQVELSQRVQKYKQLTILRLVTPNTELLARGDVNHLESSLDRCRVLEADDLEQASLLARIWRPNVILLERAICEPLDFLQQLTEYPSLADLPIVTLDAAIAQVASQIEQLNIFPCLTNPPEPSAEVLLSVLHMAAGVSWEYSVLVLDIANLDDLSDEHTYNTQASAVSLRAEWLQALIQYLQTAGFRVVMPHTWEEVQQQIQQQNVDLMLVCLGEMQQVEQACTAIATLEQQQKLPPIIAMERLFTQNEVREQFPAYLESEGRSLPSEQMHNLGNANAASDLESIERALGAIATKVLPSSISMEELLNNIHQTLLAQPVEKD
ncbi:MAG: Sensor histidine kinase RcsC [Chroococcidiopsis sp. SAG 2025]|uniref:hybrid sensor histidine kinase/response regulator n=1 Tax=Chroococcidiopsis sp. SAG 2025 TaxID=171389 RepID=UPI002936F462|nr:ATP-binding protein [Chroococcidiopsis sp. SAG 2025]MDV2994063.1 Sensor histidine kinase RcsC [Chroococcidiopsis sp. SAG 2025]